MHEIGTSRRPDRKLAVVISAGGMGTAVAQRLGQEYRMLIADIDGARAQSVAEMLCAEGADAAALACDVTDAGSVSVLAEEVARQGGFRVLAHVAGLSPSLADFATIVRVNLLGPALVAKDLLPHATVGTAAIFISSLAGHNLSPAPDIDALLKEPLLPEIAERLEAMLGPEAANPGMAYSLSKYALMAFVRRQAAAWGAKGARIVSLSPGLIASPQGALEFTKNPRKHKLLAKTPLAREGSMLEIADAVEFLASDRASFVSGTDLLVDGGLAAVLST